MRSPRGFTLVELMVVIAIIGVLVGLAVATMDPRARPDDGAKVMAGMVREAGRQAVARGPVSPAIAAVAGTTARARAIAVESGGRVRFSVELLEDNGGAPVWRELATRTVGPGLAIAGVSARAMISDGSAPETSVAPGTEVEVRCYATGLCDGRTVYFTGPNRRVARLAVLPLGGTPVTAPRW